MNLCDWYIINDKGTIALTHRCKKNNTTIIDFKIIKNKNKIDGVYLNNGILTKLTPEESLYIYNENYLIKILEMNLMNGWYKIDDPNTGTIILVHYKKNIDIKVYKKKNIIGGDFLNSDKVWIPYNSQQAQIIYDKNLLTSQIFNLN